MVYWQGIIFHTESLSDKTMASTTVIRPPLRMLMDVFFFTVVNPVEGMSDKFGYQRSLL